MFTLLALLAVAPLAQGDAAAAKPKKEAQICRRLNTTGSRMDARRVCRTKSEWAEVDAANNPHGVDADHTGVVERTRRDK